MNLLSTPHILTDKRVQKGFKLGSFLKLSELDLFSEFFFPWGGGGRLLDLMILGSGYNQKFQIPGSAPYRLFPKNRKNWNLTQYHGQDLILTHGPMCRIRQR